MMKNIKKSFSLVISLFILVLIVIFIVLPLCFGALARHYLEAGLKNWAGNHPGASYEFKTLSKGIWSSTQNVEFKFDGVSVFHSPITLLYGPVIFEDGGHLGLARIKKNISHFEGLPPTTYSGEISFLGRLRIYTHTPSPTSLIGLVSLFIGVPSPITLDSIDTQIQSDLISRSLDLNIFFNALSFKKNKLKINIPQLEFSLNNFTETHGDPNATLSLDVRGLDYQDGLNHVMIPRLSFDNYNATGSRFESIEQLMTQINNKKSPAETNGDPELVRQTVELLLLGLNKHSEIHLVLIDETIFGKGTFALDITFPKLPDSPTPLEIMKHGKYLTQLRIPSIQVFPHANGNTTDNEIRLHQFLLKETEDKSSITLDSFEIRTADQIKVKLRGLDFQSDFSHGFFGGQEAWKIDSSIDQLYFTGEEVRNLRLKNEIKGIDRNALLDSQADSLVNTIGSLLFENTPQQFDLFPLKLLLTKESEEKLTFTAKLPHGNTSLDLTLNSPNFNPKKSLSQNLVASGTLKIPSEDLNKLLSDEPAGDNAATKTAEDKNTGTTDLENIGPYDIKDTSNLSIRQLLDLIRHSWINAGFITRENQDGAMIETLEFNYSPESHIALNHKNFDDLHQAALYANIGNTEGAGELLNNPRYQENPIAQKMKDQLNQVEQSVALKTPIANTSDESEESGKAPS